jgi:hypothetical protein
VASAFVDHIEKAIEADGRTIERGKIEVTHLNILLEEATSSMLSARFQLPSRASLCAKGNKGLTEIVESARQEKSDRRQQTGAPTHPAAPDQDRFGRGGQHQALFHAS